MRKYILTSPRFTGEINVLYGLDGRLLFIDFLKCDLNEEQTDYFKSKLPAIFKDNFIEAFGNSKLSVVEEGYTVSFEQWWNRYNIKHNKARCIALWNKMSEADQVNAYFKMGNYERHLALNTWKNKADPDTYLRQRYWESEWK
ncbi:hypothetical protein [Chryseosolibacter indicus]|uniref:Uncharacterized protein n=1 Tax=Chryseosolibacter indicus TaxID=2782351 RepID=A0ABS5VQ70_9BACT|nr:hypothetical protein [Chryseosolibacter indicus]MBT1702934.1 hypothetical protein [Chryseosolibacter indicus]